MDRPGCDSTDSWRRTCRATLARSAASPGASCTAAHAFRGASVSEEMRRQRRCESVRPRCCPGSSGMLEPRGPAGFAARGGRANRSAGRCFFCIRRRGRLQPGVRSLGPVCVGCGETTRPGCRGGAARDTVLCASSRAAADHWDSKPASAVLQGSASTCDRFGSLTGSLGCRAGPGRCPAEGADTGAMPWERCCPPTGGAPLGWVGQFDPASLRGEVCPFRWKAGRARGSVWIRQGNRERERAAAERNRFGDAGVFHYCCSRTFGE